MFTKIFFMSHVNNAPSRRGTQNKCGSMGENLKHEIIPFFLVDNGSTYAIHTSSPMGAVLHPLPDYAE